MAAKPPEVLAPVPPAMPQPRSPPEYPDICGRHRLQVEAQILNREILFLEEELQSLEEAQPVSRCCNEKKKKRKSCSFIKLLSFAAISHGSAAHALALSGSENQDNVLLII
ncbi:hypothetical protein M5K25_020367 [Dendrobium thyrsiflorum]|uniref:Uncharacterized protein n=1 Tax=Dendrobium thyrsiflorum TaxID=117978 RepID=A0ABD0UH48_DENTH